MNFDAVFEGGGIKGVALAGALAKVEDAGHTLANAVGASAGAIVAALAVAGYKATDIRSIIESTPFDSFKDKGLVDYIPIIGPIASLIARKGLYEGDFFFKWMKKLLKNAPNGPIKKFGDLRKEDPMNTKVGYRFQCVASDITQKKMLVLPGDAEDFGISPDDLDVALAVRMSMSIPLFFEPVKLAPPHGIESYIVDGGCLSNFPIGILDCPRGHTPRWPTFGFLLTGDSDNTPNRIFGPVSLIMALFETMLQARDKIDVMKNADFVRTIVIPTGSVGATDFDITKGESDRLWDSGVAAADEFLKRWNWEEYLERWRA